MSYPMSNCNDLNISKLPAVRYDCRSGLLPHPNPPRPPALTPDASPAISPRSNTVTCSPNWASWKAVVTPQIPPPITRTSDSLLSDKYSYHMWKSEPIIGVGVRAVNMCPTLRRDGSGQTVCIIYSVWSKLRGALLFPAAPLLIGDRP